tara:strand:- start:318 stop:1028 length:711 start_codon:yes stop_codon:yes gene_type:complete
MIQTTTATHFTAYIQTEDNRIDTSVPSSQIRHLVKFTSDMDKSVQYAYASTEKIYNRYTSLYFISNPTPNVYLGRVSLLPAGYWKYEAYEVSWNETSFLIVAGQAPSTENDILAPSATNKGVVQGLVTKGKMYVTEKSGTEEVQYTENAKSVQTLTIVYGGVGYTSTPLITITGDNITPAKATCTVVGGVVTTVTITDAGSGYTQNPTVTLTTAGATVDGANIVANINETNYIYTG